MITDLVTTQAAFEAALAQFDSDRVLVLRLLRVTAPERRSS
jgi:hypothetical protein